MTFEPEFVALNQRLREFIVGEHGAAKPAGGDACLISITARKPGRSD